MAIFTDTRFHISIRPCLEYRIPDICILARNAFVGDASYSTVMDALEECRLMFENVPAAPPHTNWANADTQELRSLLSVVCEAVKVHLNDMASKWGVYMDDIVRNVHRRINELHCECADADRIRKQYARKNMIAHEYRAELRRVHTELGVFVTGVYDRPLPCTQRPDVLQTAAEELRRVFAESYGKMATADLLAMKNEFEHEIFVLQCGIAEKFIRKMRSHLTR